MADVRFTGFLCLSLKDRALLRDCDLVLEFFSNVYSRYFREPLIETGHLMGRKWGIPSEYEYGISTKYQILSEYWSSTDIKSVLNILSRNYGLVWNFAEVRLWIVKCWANFIKICSKIPNLWKFKFCNFFESLIFLYFWRNFAFFKLQRSKRMWIL